MSPTSRQLRKGAKFSADEKYGLHETTERLSFDDNCLPTDSAMSNAKNNIVLGCASATKRRILEERGWVFTVLESNCDLESSVGKSTDSPLHVARTIAHALLPHFEISDKPAILLTSAQVMIIKDSIRHPPENEEEAVELWQSISGQTVQFVTAVIATAYPSGEQVFELDEATATFKEISKEMSERLVRRNYTRSSKNLPVQDVELKLRCRIISGAEDSLLGMPVSTCENVLKEIMEMIPPTEMMQQISDQEILHALAEDRA